MCGHIAAYHVAQPRRLTAPPLLFFRSPAQSLGESHFARATGAEHKEDCQGDSNVYLSVLRHHGSGDIGRHSTCHLVAGKIRRTFALYMTRSRNGRKVGIPESAHIREGSSLLEK